MVGGNDLSSLLAGLQFSFTALENNPSSQVQQSQVVGSAGVLANQINALSNSYTTTRQSVQDGLVANVATLNTLLTTVGGLSDRIVAGRQGGLSTADLENQRDAALTTISSLIGVKYLEQPNGDLVVNTTGGLTLPIHGGSGLSLANAVIGPNSVVLLGSVPGILLNGQDVTTQLTGGSIGADVTLRDTTLPTYQGELDQFAQTLSTRLSQQGLTLFTDPSGNVPLATGSPPQAGYVGYALSITVNPVVAASPSLVRDGTNAVTGSPTGASTFTPNTDPGQTGFATMIQRVLDYSFGASVQSGVGQPAIPLTGLGPAGTLSAPYGGVVTLSAAAAAQVGAQSTDLGNATAALGNEQAVQTTLQTKFSATSAVNTDTELATMVKLQSSYGANAKIFTAVEAMWTQLIAAVT